jgi:hypothetical protein
MYYIKRHGGNRNHAWKTILETEDKDKADTKYNKLVEDLRQGTVELYQDETCIMRISAPRLRTKW